MDTAETGKNNRQSVLGIDFGTSNSAMAWAHGGAARLLPLEGDATTLPTAVFYNAEDRTVHFGREAIALYLGGVEGRLMRSLKSLLGSPLLQEQTVVNNELLSFQDIICQFLGELRARALRQLGTEARTLTRVVLGRPVHFVDDDAQRDQLAEATLRACAHACGFEEVDFQLEPIAAALDYERRLTQESLVLVADIGGGTSDFTVVRLGPERLRLARRARGQRRHRADDVLATSGVHIGGTDFDQKVNLEEIMPLLGFRHLGPSGREVPSAVFFDLATWHLIHWRYSAKALREAQELRTNYTDPGLHQRLMTTLTERLGHRIANEAEQAKIHASHSGEAALIELGWIERGLRARLDNAALHRHLQDPLSKVVACASECLRRSGVRPGELSAVYLTGGSSALVPFQQALAEAFAETPLVKGDLFGGVASGLAYFS